MQARTESAEMFHGAEEGFKAQVAPYITRLPLEEERDGQALSVL